MAEPVLKKGSNDPAVRDLQEALKALGHDPGPVDGIFGAKTESAVKKFQQAREIAADGVVGRVTWIIDEADQCRAEGRLDRPTRPPSAEPDERSRLQYRRRRRTLRRQDRSGGQEVAASLQPNRRRVVGPQTWQVVPKHLRVGSALVTSVRRSPVRRRGFFFGAGKTSPLLP
jgi:peptidoglycan hydrolase-like protein with peptidoglycan-binding domain